MTATEELRRLLDERGVEWKERDFRTTWKAHGGIWEAFEHKGKLNVWRKAGSYRCTPQQAIDATLGPKPTKWSNPEWERWHESLRHDEVKTIGDAVKQLMYEAIEFGGDMGPNGIVYQGIDEGDVRTSGFINSWIERFDSTLGRDMYSYEQWREISEAIGDAMEYAHDKAIEHPDKADPLWNLDEYVNRVLEVAFNGAATLGPSVTDGILHIRCAELPERIEVTLPDKRGREVYSAKVHSFERRGECHDKNGFYWRSGFECTSCGAMTNSYMFAPDDMGHETQFHFCPNCGAKVVS